MPEGLEYLGENGDGNKLGYGWGWCVCQGTPGGGARNFFSWVGLRVDGEYAERLTGWGTPGGVMRKGDWT